MVFDEPPIVAFGPRSADPHYEPHAGQDATLREGDVILLDLWAGRSLSTVFADQTWMAFAGARPPERVRTVWETVRSARDAAVSLVRDAAAAGRPIAGFEADRAARGVIEAAGFGEAFVHRTGHSIDRDLHGSGPHLDDYETHDDRLLVPGVGFSVEPGIYLSGEFGLRSELNMFWGEAGPEVTPRLAPTARASYWRRRNVVFLAELPLIKAGIEPAHRAAASRGFLLRQSGHDSRRPAGRHGAPCSAGAR